MAAGGKLSKLHEQRGGREDVTLRHGWHAEDLPVDEFRTPERLRVEQVILVPIPPMSKKVDCSHETQPTKGVPHG